MIRLVKLELYLAAVDHGSPRKRWNGKPMASEDASCAMVIAVEAAQAALRYEGFALARTSYGVTASEISG